MQQYRRCGLRNKHLGERRGTGLRRRRCETADCPLEKRETSHGKDKHSWPQTARDGGPKASRVAHTKMKQKEPGEETRGLVNCLKKNDQVAGERYQWTRAGADQCGSLLQGSMQHNQKLHHRDQGITPRCEERSVGDIDKSAADAVDQWWTEANVSWRPSRCCPQEERRNWWIFFISSFRQSPRKTTHCTHSVCTLVTNSKNRIANAMMRVASTLPVEERPQCLDMSLTAIGLHWRWNARAALAW